MIEGGETVECRLCGSCSCQLFCQACLKKINRLTTRLARLRSKTMRLTDCALRNTEEIIRSADLLTESLRGGLWDQLIDSDTPDGDCYLILEAGESWDTEL
jgi:hypothetical protein